MKSFFVTLLIIAACTSCAQQKMGIKKIYAFNQLRFPGNIPVDDNGNPQISGPDTLISIYIETTGNAPVWRNAVINGKAYAVSAALIDPVPVDIGISEHDGQHISISTGKESQLWQITLSSRDASKNILSAKPAHPSGEIILEGTYNGKPIRKVIKEQVVIKPHESV